MDFFEFSIVFHPVYFDTTVGYGREWADRGCCFNAIPTNVLSESFYLFLRSFFGKRELANLRIGENRGGGARARERFFRLQTDVMRTYRVSYRGRAMRENEKKILGITDISYRNYYLHAYFVVL